MFTINMYSHFELHLYVCVLFSVIRQQECDRQCAGGSPHSTGSCSDRLHQEENSAQPAGFQ